MTSPLPQFDNPAQANAPILLNEILEALSHVTVYGRAYTSSGLAWDYYGGRWGGFAITAGTITLSASATNYLVVAVGSGVLSKSTSSTNWNDAANYARAYKITTGASSVTSYEDHRAGARGLFGDGSDGGGGVLVLTDGANIAVDASAHSSFRVTLGGNRTFDNPTGMSDGQVLNFRIWQDGTGSRTAAFGSKYTFPAGASSTLSTAAGALDFMSCEYQTTDDFFVCSLLKDFS